MLFKVHQHEYKETGSNLQKMQTAKIPEMSLFHQELRRASKPATTEETQTEPLNRYQDDYHEVAVTFKPPRTSGKQESMLCIPLRPCVNGLERVTVDLYSSKTEAYKMGTSYSEWFSACFGWPVILVYLGSENLRPVLGNLPKDARPILTDEPSTISSAVKATFGWWNGTPAKGKPAEEITFADLAPYLVATEESLDDVSSRLPERMDITKFRPNIVISGSPKPWDEDYWGSLSIRCGARTENAELKGSTIDLDITANCVRCTSINVDYSTGKFGTGEMGKALKTLSSYRRIDTGKKYSPVFGRYGFLKKGQKGTIAVGDEVVVSRRNAERTRFGEIVVLKLWGLANVDQNGQETSLPNELVRGASPLIHRRRRYRPPSSQYRIHRIGELVWRGRQISRQDQNLRTELKDSLGRPRSRCDFRPSFRHVTFE